MSTHGGDPESLHADVGQGHQRNVLQGISIPPFNHSTNIAGISQDWFSTRQPGEGGLNSGQARLLDTHLRGANRWIREVQEKVLREAHRLEGFIQ